VPTVVPSNPGAISIAELPPELAKIVAAWNDLPEAVRVGINAMVAAVGGGD